jgi:HAD superfamily hydrolase (TIGR01509 family)
MPPKFLYCDLGKVLINFSVEQMFRQMGEVAGVEPARVRAAVIESGLQRQYELGQVSSREFYEAFCRGTLSRPDYAALARAANDIFELNASILPVVDQLHQAGYRLGILSNTCENHWEHCRAHFPWLNDAFAVHALSFRIGACKPEAAIFHAAAELAGCQPREIFFTDDIAEHVAGAKAVGFDAVQYTGTPQLVADLRQRGIRFNY